MRNMVLKFQRFMVGRYGLDKLSTTLLYSGLAIVLLFTIFRLPLISFIGWAAVIFSYYRIFSKQRTKRYQENQKFLAFKNQLTREWNKRRNRFYQRKSYKFYSCPNCHKEVRVPRHKGKIKITCPRCHEQFIKKT